MNKALITKENRLFYKDRLKNKKLVKILNHKMFKGYRDIKASKKFYKQNLNFHKNTLGCMEWEKKTYDYYDDLYNLNYKLNVLAKLKNPTFNNMIYIKHYPFNRNNDQKTIFNNDSKIKITKSSLNTFSNSNPNLTTMNSLGKKSKIQTDSNNNFYLTSMSVYHTDNFYHEYRPEKIYKEIFDKDNVYYNDIPILSLEKINKYNNPKKKKKYKYITSDDEIIPANNIHDNMYAGLTERQFLYKISHNKSNKNIQEKVNINSFIKNKKVVKINDLRRLKSAAQGKKIKSNLLNMNDKGPKNINIDLIINDLGGLEINQIISTTTNSTKQEKIYDKQNQFLVYNSAYNTDISSKSNNKNSSKISSLNKTNTIKEDRIFGDPFKNIKKNYKNEEPPIKTFQNKPRILDDKLMVHLQLLKKNQFSKLKKIMDSENLI